MCYDNIHNVIPRKRDSVVDARCYELSVYEKDALKQIKEFVDNGYENSQDLVREHLSYLSHLLQKLGGILDCERTVGAPLTSLENDIERIRKLHIEVEHIYSRIKNR